LDPKILKRLRKCDKLLSIGTFSLGITRFTSHPNLEVPEAIDAAPTLAGREVDEFCEHLPCSSINKSISLLSKRQESLRVPNFQANALI
jgi:hypothetical protein